MRIFVLLLVLLVGPALAADDELRMDVAGTIVIGKDGSVHDYKIATTVTPEIRQVIEHSVRQWRFEPVPRNGEPVLARSQMFLTLAALPVEKGYRLRIDNVLFGGGRKNRHMSHPDYPRDAMRAGISAYVLVALQIDKNGEVLNAVATQSEMFGVRRSTKWLKRQFERASEDAVKLWRFEPADLAAGEPEQTTLIVPFTFSAGDRPYAFDGWRTSAAESKPIPWLPANQQEYDASGLKDGQSLALGTGIELVTKVEGSML